MKTSKIFSFLLLLGVLLSSDFIMAKQGEEGGEKISLEQLECNVLKMCLEINQTIIEDRKNNDFMIRKMIRKLQDNWAALNENYPDESLERRALDQRLILSQAVASCIHMATAMAMAKEILNQLKDKNDSRSALDRYMDEQMEYVNQTEK